MTGQGPRRSVVDGEWSGRLTQAREFLESARSFVTLAENRSYYGARSTTHGEAVRLMADLDDFAAWAEGAL